MVDALVPRRDSSSAGQTCLKCITLSAQLASFRSPYTCPALPPSPSPLQDQIPQVVEKAAVSEGGTAEAQRRAAACGKALDLHLTRLRCAVCAEVLQYCLHQQLACACGCLCS